MKKILSLILAVLIGILFIGCGNSKGDLQGDRQVTAGQSENVPGESSKEADTTSKPGTANKPAETNTGTGTGFSIADSYSAFLDAKSAMTEKIIDGLSSDPDLALVSFELVGVVLVDMILIPAAFLGMGEKAAISGLGMLNFTDVEYTENGDSYTLKYNDNEGKSYMFTGEYDETADSLVCTVTKDGQNTLNAEYYKTSFGYVGQYYSVNDDGSADIYRLSIQGEDGVLGVSDSDEFTPLTGNETIDFPKDSKEWYAVFGDTVTGVTNDGKELNFKYTP